MRQGSRRRTRKTTTGILTPESLIRYGLIARRDRATQLWQGAISDLRSELTHHVVNSKGAELRFQQGKLIGKLCNAAYAEKKGHDEIIRSLTDCYWFVTESPWAGRLGYDDARRLHFEEMNARGFVPWAASPSKEKIAKELEPRLESVASWLEAHESFLIWRMLNSNRAAWDANDSNARHRAGMAGLLADLPSQWLKLASKSWEPYIPIPIWKMVVTFLVSERLDVNEDGSGNFVPWSRARWANILRQATNLAGKTPKDATPPENWVWWLYPVFYRYHWSASDVCKLAGEKFPEEKMFERDFTQYWIRRGLRFTGKFRKRRRGWDPPFKEFVKHADVPRTASLEFPVWYWDSDRFCYENSTSPQ